MSGIKTSQDVEQLGDTQPSEDNEGIKCLHPGLEQQTDDSTPEQDEMTTAKCADGKQLQVQL
jgi:hypothetical protein